VLLRINKISNKASNSAGKHNALVSSAMPVLSIQTFHLYTTKLYYMHIHVHVHTLSAC